MPTTSSVFFQVIEKHFFFFFFFCNLKLEVSNPPKRWNKSLGRSRHTWYFFIFIFLILFSTCLQISLHHYIVQIRQFKRKCTDFTQNWKAVDRWYRSNIVSLAWSKAGETKCHLETTECMQNTCFTQSKACDETRKGTQTKLSL